MCPKPINVGHCDLLSQSPTISQVPSGNFARNPLIYFQLQNIQKRIRYHDIVELVMKCLCIAFTIRTLSNFYTLLDVLDHVTYVFSLQHRIPIQNIQRLGHTMISVGTRSQYFTHCPLVILMIGNMI